MSDNGYLIDLGRVRKLALHISATKRAGKFKRVGADFYNRIDARLKVLACHEVAAQAAGGQTLYGQGAKQVQDPVGREIEVGKLLFDAHRLRDLALYASQSRKHGAFTRVGHQFYELMNAKLHAVIAGEIHRHPSVGQTLK